jgi:HlyD family secretion protein
MKTPLSRRTSDISVNRLLAASLVIAGLTACNKTTVPDLQIPTDRASRRSIVVTADATGKIEPINVIDIKSKAGGQIMEMPVETGTHVSKGDLIVDLDKTDVMASLEQAKADSETAVARLKQSQTVAARQQQLFESKVITLQELENSRLDLTTQSGAVLRSNQAMTLARQRVADARILAPTDGIILDKLVSQGTVIASASNSASGGTTLVRMADLSRVRARVLVSETDIGKVQVGMDATIKVDAFPNREFTGKVEKMEPQAIVDQNVTMFPVMVILENEDGALMPGMNGEVSILVERKNSALSIPLDAFRLSNEAGAVAEMFGISKEKVDSINREGAQKALQARRVGADAAASGDVPVGRGGNRPAPTGDPATPGRGAREGSGSAGAGRGGQSGGQGGRGTPVVVDAAQCTAMTGAIAKVSGLQKQLDDNRAAMNADGADRRALMTERTSLLEKAGIDGGVYSGCMRLTAAGGVAGAPNGGSMGNGGGGRGGRGGRGGGGGRRGGGGGFAGNLGQRNNGLGVRGQGIASKGIVFVKIGEDTTVKPIKALFEARYVELGSQNYDFAEVTFGLNEGEEVALMAAAKIALQRQQSANRMKANSSVIPGVGSPGRGPGGGGPRGGSRGGD